MEVQEKHPNQYAAVVGLSFKLITHAGFTGEGKGCSSQAESSLSVFAKRKRVSRGRFVFMAQGQNVSSVRWYSSYLDLDATFLKLKSEPKAPFLELSEDAMALGKPDAADVHHRTPGR